MQKSRELHVFISDQVNKIKTLNNTMDKKKKKDLNQKINQIKMNIK